jgi:hypothetical protein
VSPEPLVHPLPRFRDPLVRLGLVVVVATAVFLVALAWSYWDTADFAAFDDESGPSFVDRLRVMTAVLNPALAGLLLLGVVLASLRELLHLLDTAPQPDPARAFARNLGAFVGVVLAAAGLLAAIDIAFIRDGETILFPSDARWQQALYHLSTAMLGAATAWTVMRKDRPVPPDDPEDLDSVWR